MWWAYRSRPVFRGMTPEQASLERYRMSIEPFRGRFVLVASIVLGLLGGLTAAGEWGTFLLWRNAVPFDQVDPQFGLDLSFYTFTLPFIQFVLGYAFAVVIIALIAAVVVQYLYGGLRLQPRGDRATKAAQVQISLLLALLLLVKAVSYWFDRYALMVKSEPLVTGFTGMKYVDVNAVLPSLNILTFVAVIVALLFLLNAFRQFWAIPLIGLGLMIVTGLMVGSLRALWPWEDEDRGLQAPNEAVPSAILFFAIGVLVVVGLMIAERRLGVSEEQEDSRMPTDAP